MAYEHSLDTDDGAIPAALRHFLRRRAFELSGLVLLAAIMAAGLALASWNVTDPSFNHATETAARNWLGFPGAALADQVMQLLGLSAIPLLAIPMAWVSAFFRHESPARPFRTLLLWLAAVIVLAGFL
ncbi:MAG TPA: DNA translocase FtsK 4TM domain-containing protein, partial [Aestuariivirga sp.]|nr:DNA translocase FtsK 4TM domain-containing protein [Aestuariivirga sp.]